MTEPSVDFELAGIEDPKSRTMFDQIRRWFDFREDRKYPSMQTFTGKLDNNGEIDLKVPGVIYGYSGFGERPLGGVPTYWDPMMFSVGGVSSGRIGFLGDLENIDGSFVRVFCNSDGPALRYRVTIFYRDVE